MGVGGAAWTSSEKSERGMLSCAEGARLDLRAEKALTVFVMAGLPH